MQQSVSDYTPACSYLFAHVTPAGLTPLVDWAWMARGRSHFRFAGRASLSSKSGE